MRQLLQRSSTLAALVLLLLPAAALAAAPQPAPLTAQDNLELQRIAAYLNGIRTMTARFSQVTGNGGTYTSTGWSWGDGYNGVVVRHNRSGSITLWVAGDGAAARAAELVGELGFPVHGAG